LAEKTCSVEELFMRAKKTKNIAVAWIRDGVLVNRMHINPVALAFASLRHLAPENKNNSDLLVELINFGFAKSGYSAAEKMRLYNLSAKNIINDVEKASQDYDRIATEAAKKAEYFPGAPELLENLHRVGILNFITSAVDQPVLDKWARNDASGRKIAPYLTEILGARPGFLKGRDHFEHIIKKYGVERIYYVADAVSEIKTGAELAGDYGIIPIGFAHVVTINDIMAGIKLVSRTTEDLFGTDFKKIKIDPQRIKLSAENKIVESLKKAGAHKIIIRNKREIIFNLKRYFVNNGLINRKCIRK